MTEVAAGLVGAVLAGGRSRRFGSDKARAEVGGRALVGRSLDALAPSVDRSAVVLPAPGAAGPSLPAPAFASPFSGSSADLGDVVVLRDSREGVGPLEGLRVALVWAAGEGAAGVVVLSCDVPLVDGATVAGLVDAWRGRLHGDSHGVVPVAGGRDQPLVAVYSVEVLPVVEERLEGEDRSLRGMLRVLDVLRVPAARLVPAGSAVPAEERFLNVNTRGERERAERLLERVEAASGGE